MQYILQSYIRIVTAIYTSHIDVYLLQYILQSYMRVVNAVHTTVVCSIYIQLLWYILQSCIHIITVVYTIPHIVQLTLVHTIVVLTYSYCNVYYSRKSIYLLQYILQSYIRILTAVYIIVVYMKLLFYILQLHMRIVTVVYSIRRINVYTALSICIYDYSTYYSNDRYQLVQYILYSHIYLQLLKYILQSYKRTDTAVHTIYVYTTIVCTIVTIGVYDIVCSTYHIYLQLEVINAEISETIKVFWLTCINHLLSRRHQCQFS